MNWHMFLLVVYEGDMFGVLEDDDVAVH